MRLIEDAVEWFILLFGVLLNQWRVSGFNRKYRLTHDQQSELLGFLMGVSGLKRLVVQRPDFVQKEFPETYRNYIKFRLAS
jgi:hypothetical protein